MRIAEYSYDAFGNQLEGEEGWNPFKYCGIFGYREDEETGLMKVGARYYDPMIGRWIQKDPILDGFNWWIYCENDPVNGVDPEGKTLKPLFDFLWPFRMILSYSLLLVDIALGARDLPDVPYPSHYPSDFYAGKPPQGMDCPFPNRPCRPPHWPKDGRGPGGPPGGSACGRGAHLGIIFAFALLIGSRRRKREDINS